MAFIGGVLLVPLLAFGAPVIWKTYKRRARAAKRKGDDDDDDNGSASDAEEAGWGMPNIIPTRVTAWGRTVAER